LCDIQGPQITYPGGSDQTGLPPPLPNTCLITLCVKHSMPMWRTLSQLSALQGLLLLLLAWLAGWAAGAQGCTAAGPSAGRPRLLTAAAAMPARPNNVKVDAQPTCCRAGQGRQGG